jgi:hypothetical protein
LYTFQVECLQSCEIFQGWQLLKLITSDRSSVRGLDRVAKAGSRCRCLQLFNWRIRSDVRCPEVAGADSHSGTDAAELQGCKVLATAEGTPHKATAATAEHAEWPAVATN